MAKVKIIAKFKLKSKPKSDLVDIRLMNYSPILLPKNKKGVKPM